MTEVAHSPKSDDTIIRNEGELPDNAPTTEVAGHPTTNHEATEATAAAAATHAPSTATDLTVAATAAATATPGTSAGTNPFEEHSVEHTPVLPPRPEAEMEQAATTAYAMDAAERQGINLELGRDVPPEEEQHVSKEVAALRAMFPDFDVMVLQSVLESVNNDQERAVDILLGMSDPDYVSTHAAAPQHEQQSTDLDEQLARQLMLEDQRQADRGRPHATGNSWPRQSQEQVPYQARQHPQAGGRPVESERATDFQELQRTMGQIAESGKRTFSSIVSRVKAKINEFDQNRTAGGAGQGSHSTMPQWGSAPPAQVDRHTASQAYQQAYYAPGPPVPPQQPSPNAEPHQVSLHDDTHSQVQGYSVDAPPVQSKPSPQTPPASSTAPIPTPAARSASPAVGSGLSPAPSPRPSGDVPRPPTTVSGSPVNAAKIGLLPKRPVSLMNASSPPATRPSDDDDELEYVENPFEERK